MIKTTGQKIIDLMKSIGRMTKTSLEKMKLRNTDYVHEFNLAANSSDEFEIVGRWKWDFVMCGIRCSVPSILQNDIEVKVEQLEVSDGTLSGGFESNGFAPINVQFGSNLPYYEEDKDFLRYCGEAPVFRIRVKNPNASPARVGVLIAGWEVKE